MPRRRRLAAGLIHFMIRLKRWPCASVVCSAVVVILIVMGKEELGQNGGVKPATDARTLKGLGEAFLSSAEPSAGDSVEFQVMIKNEDLQRNLVIHRHAKNVICFTDRDVRFVHRKRV